MTQENCIWIFDFSLRESLKQILDDAEYACAIINQATKSTYISGSFNSYQGAPVSRNVGKYYLVFVDDQSNFKIGSR